MILHDSIVAFFFMAGLIFGYLFFIWWLNWFYKNYKIEKRDDNK